ncbi:E3 ubiquitin-protein ligase rnf14, partial [Coemansia sp. RSA 370]
NILRMICPHADCQAPDTATAISDSELAKLVSNEQMKRIRRLRNQRRAETDSTNYAMCARTGCDLVVKNDTQVDRLCVCECGFTFCRMCRCTWHGVNRCAIKDVRELVEKYWQACMDEAEDGSSKERKYLERRHGKAFMRQYRRYIEEALSLEYIDANSVQCPK